MILFVLWLHYRRYSNGYRRTSIVTETIEESSRLSMNIAPCSNMPNNNNQRNSNQITDSLHYESIIPEESMKKEDILKEKEFFKNNELEKQDIKRRLNFNNENSNSIESEIEIEKDSDIITPRKRRSTLIQQRVEYYQ